MVRQSMLLVRRVGDGRGSNLKPFDYEANALPTEPFQGNQWKRYLIPNLPE